MDDNRAIEHEPTTPQPLYAAVEAGGTTFVCAVGSGPCDLRARTELPTEAPEPTLARVLEFFEPHRGELAAVGIGSFGPVDRRRGAIAATPKPRWSGTPLAERIGEGLGGLPVGFDTDVNAAALAEGRWGAALGLDHYAYVTVGTGIGGAGVLDGHLIHGLLHPEMGHMRIPRHPRDRLQAGACPFHRDCWEGWAARDAISKRWGEGRLATELTAPQDLELLAHYLAAGVVNIILTLSPQRVILGGGVVLGGGSHEHRERLLALVRTEVLTVLNGYPPAAQIGERIDSYIVAPALGADAGVLGAIVLAQQAARAGR